MLQLVLIVAIDRATRTVSNTPKASELIALFTSLIASLAALTYQTSMRISKTIILMIALDTNSVYSTSNHDELIMLSGND